MKTSVIIPTFDRQNNLKQTISAILQNSTLPNEIIIVEQGNINKTKEVINNINSITKIKVIPSNIKSASIARNIGVKNTTGDILFFLDDDIIIDTHYIQIALDFFNKNPQVKGLAPKDILLKTQTKIFLKLFSQLFFLNHLKLKAKILRSGANTDINTGNDTTYIEYLSPGHMIVKKEIFTKDSIWFPNTFLGYSFGEGIYFSYQVFLKYPKSLIYYPNLKVKNIGKKIQKKDSNLSIEKMKIIYRFIFWHKFIFNNNPYYKNKFLNLLAYLWSQFGLFLVDIYSRKPLKVFKTKIKTYLYLMKNYKKIINNTVDYNSFIYKN